EGVWRAAGGSFGGLNAIHRLKRDWAEQSRPTEGSNGNPSHAAWKLSGHTVLRVQALLPAWRTLCGWSDPPLATALLRPARYAQRIHAGGLACARNVVRICRRSGNRLPADGNSELDRETSS